MKTKIFILLVVLISLTGISEMKSQMDTVWSYPMPANYSPKSWAFSPNDSLIAIALTKDNSDTTLFAYSILINTLTGQEIRQIRSRRGYGDDFVIFSPDNRFLLTSDLSYWHGKPNILIRDVSSGDSLRILTIDSLKNLDGLDYFATDIQFTPDGRYLFANISKYFLSGDKVENFNQFVFWDTTNWQIAKQWKSYNQPAKMVISPTGNYYAYYASGKLGNFMYISSLDEADTLITKFNLGDKLAFFWIFSNNGHYLASQCNEDSILIWDMDSMKLYTSLNIYLNNNIGFATDSSYLITKGQYYSTVIWNIKTKNSIYDYHDTLLSLPDMLVSNLGYYILIGDYKTKRFYLYNSHFTPNQVVEHDDNHEQSIIYPNPTDKITKLKFNSSEISMVSIQIIDSEGKIVKDIGEKILEQGENDINLECNGLTSGIYFCRMTGKTINKTYKIIINK